MRIPYPWAILLSLAVVMLLAWHGTRNMDFLTPPSDEELAAIRSRAEAAFPRTNRQEDAISIPPAALEGDGSVVPLISAPALGDYLDLAPDGAQGLIELAKRLEQEGSLDRSLLAWERILDRAEASPTQIAEATAALMRLKHQVPRWNSSPSDAITVVLHVGTSPKMAEVMEPILRDLAENLSRYSSGILHVKPLVTAGRIQTIPDGPMPVAVWLAGPAKADPSTDVLSFTATPDSTSLDQKLAATVGRLIREHFRDSQLKSPPSPTKDESPYAALNYKISRLAWESFGKSLQTPAP